LNYKIFIVYKYLKPILIINFFFYIPEVIVEDCVGLDSPPECDVLPHINLGPNFQALIPPVSKIRPTREPSNDYLLWDPCITSSVSDREGEYD